MKPDRKWFEKVIRESEHSSLRQLAPKLRRRDGASLDPSALSRMLRGDREVLLHEARQLADLLDQPLAEVIRRLGVPFGRGDVTGSGRPRR